MPLLVTEAAKLAMEDRQRGIIEEIITQDELFALFPFVQAKDKVYSYVRENTLASGDWYSAYEDIEESASTFTPVSTSLKVLAGQVDIDNFTAEVQSELNDQVAIQIAAKAKGMGRQFRDVLVNGNATTLPKTFDGLKTLITAGQTTYAGVNGGPVSFALLDEMRDNVRLGIDCFMMRQGTWRAIRELSRLLGGNSADMMQIENFGKPVKAYDGVPVIINEFISATETRGTNTNTTSIYGLRLNEADGFHGLYGGASAGIRLEDLGNLQGRDARRFRMKWYCGAALKARNSVARLSGITNV